MFVTNSLYRQTAVGYWSCRFATNSFSRRTGVQISFCPPHWVPCATRYANLPVSTKPPRHRGDCAKGARKVFSQAATLQSSRNPRRAKHIKPQRFDWRLQSNGRARAWIRPWSLPAWIVSRVGHRQVSTLPNKKLDQVRDSFIPTVRRRQCRVLQLTLDVKDFFLLEITRPILWGALNLHFICAHGHDHGDLHQHSLQNVFQATRRFDASKQHRRLIRRFVDHGSVQRPLLYGLETVRVLPGNAVQLIPTFFVGVSPPDILFSHRSPLASAGGHGGNCDLTDSPYRNTKLEVWNYAIDCNRPFSYKLEHDASHLTDLSLWEDKTTSRGNEVQVHNYKSLFQCAGTARNDAFNHRRAKVQLQICMFGSKLITRFNDHDYLLHYLLPSVTLSCKPNTSQS